MKVLASNKSAQEALTCYEEFTRKEEEKPRGFFHLKKTFIIQVDNTNKTKFNIIQVNSATKWIWWLFNVVFGSCKKENIDKKNVYTFLQTAGVFEENRVIEQKLKFFSDRVGLESGLDPLLSGQAQN